jgi:hypothetical protein
LQAARREDPEREREHRRDQGRHDHEPLPVERDRIGSPREHVHGRARPDGDGSEPQDAPHPLVRFVMPTDDPCARRDQRDDARDIRRDLLGHAGRSSDRDREAGQRGGSSCVSEDPDEAGADVGPLVYQA